MLYLILKGNEVLYLPLSNSQNNVLLLATLVISGDEHYFLYLAGLTLKANLDRTIARFMCTLFKQLQVLKLRKLKQGNHEGARNSH